MTADAESQMMDALVARLEREQPLIEQLVAEGVHPVTAHIMTVDKLSMEDARERIAHGSNPIREMNLVGSYARWQFAFDLWNDNIITARQFFAQIVERWRGSDPDDGVQWLPVWFEARRRNGGFYLRDGKPLPRTKRITVWRGQTNGADPLGIAWSTDPEIARKFAFGAGSRVPFKTGHLFGGYVERKHVYAFITGRNESEVICDPMLVTLEVSQRVHRSNHRRLRPPGAGTLVR